MIVDFIVSWIKVNLNIECDPKQNFFENHTLDSLNFAELISAIEHNFSIDIQFDQMTDWTIVNTPLGLAEYISGPNEK
jgi:acyl carrier protein